ncbi:LysR family transcriptional regulator [Thioclava sp. FR2]|uniref:LysR family transcriptional regulator n=1 Tax=Thioclava sp. FR2 TaxID=3445780 RepID=UPI003EBA9817
MNFATFDLNLLRVLDALLSEGSTVRAAEKLNLSQSAVSGSLARLRDALGDQLFVRHGNRLVPTDFAQQIALPLHAELDRIQALLAPAPVFDPALASGVFRISATDFFAELLMPRLAQALLNEAPGIVAQLVDVTPSNYLDSLEAEGADLLLVPDRPAPAWAAKKTLFASPFVIIARRENPHLTGFTDGTTMPIDLFCELGHVLMSPEGNLRAMGDSALERIGRNRRIMLTVPVFSGVLRAVSESDLIALVPLQLAERLAKQYGLIHFQPPMQMPAPQICAYWHARQTKSPQHEFLRKLIFSILSDLAAPPAPPIAP